MQSVPTIGVLAIQGGVREHLLALDSAGARGTLVKTVEQLNAVNGLVIPGGESSTMDKLARTFELMEPLREARASGIPMLGSCAGMIMLADRIIGAITGQESIGGLDITVERNAFGGQTESFETAIAIGGIRDPEREFEGIFIRAPWVVATGESVEVIAKISGGPHEGRIVGVRSDTLMATSFHPELTTDSRVHELFVEMVRNS